MAAGGINAALGADDNPQLHAEDTLKSGGEIAGRATILAEGDAANRDDLIYLEKLPLFDKNGKEL
jgi:aspartate oxidase